MANESVKLFGSPGSRLTRASWMCEEIGVGYEIVAAKPHSPQLLALNPSGKGPILVDDDATVIDSAAICMFLADRYGAETFSAPPGSAERGEIDSWLHFAQLDLEGPLWLKLKHTFLLPEERRVDVGQYPREEFALAIKAMEARLGDREFAIGDRFTAADVLLGHCGQWARAGKFSVESATVNAYFDRVLSRPALARAKAREQAIKERISA